MQVNTPQSLFDAPDNLFVATFIGSPAMNLVEAKLVKTRARRWCSPTTRSPCPRSWSAPREGWTATSTSS